MNQVKRVFAMIFTVVFMLSFVTVVNADPDPNPDPNAPDNTRYNYLYVSAGGSSYSATYSTTTGIRTQCYMRLRWFQLDGYSACYMPSGYYIYTRLYTYSSHVKASNYASFNRTTTPGHYNYAYLNGYGGSGNQYQLKTNSNYSSEFYARYDWSSNPY